MTSERFFGISPQPEDTCPIVDAAIEACRNASNLEDPLEDLRESCSNIRAWGREWRDEAEKLWYEFTKAEERLQELENELAETQSELRQATEALHNKSPTNSTGSPSMQVKSKRGPSANLSEVPFGHAVCIKGTYFIRAEPDGCVLNKTGEHAPFCLIDLRSGALLPTDHDLIVELAPGHFQLT